MEEQAKVTYHAKVMPRTPNRLEGNTPSIFQQYIPPIAKLLKQ